MGDLFFLLEGKKTFSKIKKHGQQLIISEEILDQYHMSENRLKDFLASKLTTPIDFENDGLVFTLNGSLLKDIPPIKYNLNEKYYALPMKKSNYFHFPELLIHYLLLYNLSMISRYETEWWSELVKTMPNRDYPFIQSFLDITLEKGPFLIHQFLMD